MPSVFKQSNEWDGVAFALYPRRSSYLQLQKTEDYQLAIPDRWAGTYARMLYVLSDVDGIYKAENTIEGFHKNNIRVTFEEGDVVVSQFWNVAVKRVKRAMKSLPLFSPRYWKSQVVLWCYQRTLKCQLCQTNIGIIL